MPRKVDGGRLFDVTSKLRASLALVFLFAAGARAQEQDAAVEEAVDARPCPNDQLMQLKIG